jgi:hypothetical protein
MTDLHERLTAAVNARLRITERCTPVNADAGYAWEQRCETDVIDAAGVPVATNIGPLDAEHIAANDPATVIRHCLRDLKVLERHTFVPAGVNCGCDVALCGCGEHVLWPCDDLVWLAAAYDVPTTPVLPDGQPVEHGSSPPG